MAAIYSGSDRPHKREQAPAKTLGGEALEPVRVPEGRICPRGLAAAVWPSRVCTLRRGHLIVKPEKPLPRYQCRILCLALALFLSFPPAHAELSPNKNASVSGNITDSTGAIVPGAQVKIQPKDGTGEFAGRKTKAGPDGHFQFGQLAPGLYDVEADAPGLQPVDRDVQVSAGSSVRITLSLPVAEVRQMVSVRANGLHVQTRTTESGLMLGKKQLEQVPLNGRSFTDLLAIQPGVVPQSSAQPDAVEMSGVTSTPPSGGLDPGTLSVLGQRESANSFRVDGADAQEDVNRGAAIVPSLDAIANLTVLTNNMDPKYGGAAGGQIEVTTRSGSNAWHGSLFNYFRNTALDARNFFSQQRASYHQNQFGGALGGPVKKNKLYFFADYQGTRQTQGVDTGQISVPTMDERAGNFSGSSLLTGSVSEPYWASVLTQRLGYNVAQGEPYYTSACITTSQCVFPDGKIPRRAWSPAAAHLLSAIPKPNAGAGVFSTSALPRITRDDKASLRLDAPTRYGALMAYYFFDDYRVNNPYPTAQGGASIPGFNALNYGRAQLLALSDTKAIGANAVNVASFSYMRNAAHVGEPVGGLGPTAADQGIEGIYPVMPSIQGTENVILNDLTFGIDVTELFQAENIFEVRDDFSRSLGRNLIEVGIDLHADQINTHPDVYPNGSFAFTGSETGSDFADFLLGIDSNYTQGQGRFFYNRDRFFGAYAQDSWKMLPTVTLNYGVRWDVLPPWWEKYNQLVTIVPGESSVVFPGAPKGLVFPGDPGVPRTLAPTRYGDLVPRVGLAWSPAAKHGLLAKLTGMPGTTSIHLGFGQFDTPISGLSPAIMSGNPPYGFTYTTAVPTLLDEPFTSALTGKSLGQRFPLPQLPYGATAQHPIRGIDWKQYEPVVGVPGFSPTNVTPYAEDYSVNVERALSRNTVLKLGYDGTQAHHLLVLEEANPGNPLLCLSLSQPQDVAPGSPMCGPFGESGTYTRANGQVVDGTRETLGPDFDSVTYQKTIGNSHDNALVASLQHSGPRLYFLLAYTWSKSIDQSSSLAEAVDPVDPSRSRALSSFNLTQNFVASYSYQLPVERWMSKYNRSTRGWQISGLTRMSTGFPVTLVNNNDTSLLGSQPNGVNNYGVDQLRFTPGNLKLNSSPLRSKYAFDTALFSLPALGHFGNARRRFFSGPGENNTDLAVQKTTQTFRGQKVALRIEAFNVFNHAQFFGPAAVEGNIGSNDFGQIQMASPPRLMQASVQYRF